MCLKPRSPTMVLADRIKRALHQVMDREMLFSCGHSLNLKPLSSEEWDRFTATRTACLHYMRCAHVFFKTHPDTFATAVHILDVFLWKFKVTVRLMSICAIACYVIAAKITEEREMVPSHHELAQLPGNEWTKHDLCRMEKCILDKLSWAPPPVSHLDYLPLFTELFDLNKNTILSSDMIALAERFLKEESTVFSSPRVLALALVLKTAPRPDDTITKEKQKQVMQLCQIEETKLSECMGKLDLLSPTSYSPLPNARIRTGVNFPVKIFTKPSEMGSTDLATIEE